MPAFILDTETTGVKDPEPIQLAWSMPSYLGQSPDTTHAVGSRMFKPQAPITFGARAVHHILDEDLEGLPPYDATFDLPDCGLFPTFEQAIQQETFSEQYYWVGHNIDFDWECLGRPPVLRICTMALARRYWPECDSHSLGALMYWCFGSEAKRWLKEAHDARADVFMTERLLGHMLQTIPQLMEVTTWIELWNLSEDARIPTHWPFGKFKGQPIGDTDRGYLKWCLNQPDMDPYVTEAIRRIY